MRFGVAEKLTGLVVAVILLLGFYLGAYFTRHETRQLTTSLEKRVEVLLANLSANLGYPVLVQDDAAIARLVEGVLSQPEISKCIVEDRDGEVLYQQGQPVTSSKRVFTSAISVEQALRTSDEALIFGESETAIEVIGEVSLHVSLLGLEEQIGRMTRTIALLVLAAVVIASLATFLLLRVFLGRPVAMLADATRRIARGELEVEVPIERADEIGTLATAFNAMTAELQNTMVSREYVDKILDSMIDALIVLEPTGHITRINTATEVLLSYHGDELLGKPVDMLFAAGRPHTATGDFDPSSPDGAYMQNTETLLRSSSGADVPVLLSSSATTDTDGHVQAVVCVALDIREQKKAQEEIRKLSTAVQQSTGGIALADLEGKLTYVNNAFAQMHGRAPEGMLDTPLADLHPPERRARMEEMLERIRQSGAWAGEMESLAADGGVFPTYVSASILRDEGGFPISIVVHANDMTSQKELELQLVQAQKLDSIGQLAGGVAHDFNNMLGAISGYADMIRQRFGADNAGIHKYASRILEAANRSADLTSKLLAFARKGSYETVQVDMHATIQDVITILEHTIDRRISIVKELKAPVATVMGDRTQLQNAVLNLAVNARDAMPEGGAMTFATSLVLSRQVPHPGDRPARKATHYLRVSVVDTGIGMDEATRNRIFEPFFTTKQLGKGTGLGLASVYGTIQSHFGVIDVHSELDKGSTFDIYLPLAVSAAKETEQSDAVVQEGSGTILIVDDEQLVREMAADMLADIGYDVLSCADGLEAVEYYREHRDEIDLVVLDMIMPRLGGYECFARLREINPAVCVIVSSGYSVNDEAKRVLSAGAHSFVQKPFDLKALSTAIREALAAPGVE